MGWFKLFGREQKKSQVMFRLEAAVPEEENKEICNPGRGWYQLYSFAAQDKMIPEQVQGDLANKDTLALVLIDIGAYREVAVSEQGIENIREILDFFAKAGRDIILRIVYDREGKGLEREPAFFSQVIKHIRQLSPIIREFEKHILTLQGVLVGSWGEMHGSRYLSQEKLCTLAQELREGCGDRLPLAVRTPVYWRSLEQEWESREGEAYFGRFGLFDDGMFGSDTHLGTFAEEEGRTSWKESWGTEEELAFEGWLGNYVLCGGEAVAPQGGEEAGWNGDRVIERLRQMHVTYLNRTYDEKLLNHWKEIDSPVKGIWERKSCYDYVGSHLGYRFVVRGVRLISKEGSEGERKKESRENRIEVEGEKALLEIEIENSGFAGIYQEVEVWLEVEEAGKCRSILVDCDVRAWKSGTINVLAVPLGGVIDKADTEQNSWEEENGCNRSWKLYLRMNRKWDGQRILFGNQSEENGRVLLGYLEQR